MRLRPFLVILALVSLNASMVSPPCSTAALPEAARDSRWIRLQSPNFICYTNAEQWTVSKLLRDLERLREALSQSTQGFERQSPVPNYIMVFRDLNSFDPYNAIPQGEEGTTIGYFSGGRIVGYLALAVSSRGEAKRVIYHEFVHSVLYANIPGLPLWLNEGLAELYTTFKSKGLTAEIGKPIDDYIDWLQREPLFPLKTLLVITHDDPQYNHSQRKATFYAESWALTHMMAIPEQGRDKFSDFLERIGEGSSGKAALDHVYGKASYDSLQTALHEYLKERSFKSRKIQFTKNFEDVPVQAYAVERKEILLRLGDLQTRHHPPRISEARKHYQRALRLDASFVPAIVALGVTYQQTGQPDLADSLFSVAVQMDPANSDALLYAGQSLANNCTDVRSPVSRDTPPPCLLEARNLLSSSLDLAPNQPEALAALGKTYLDEWGDSVAVGLWALQEASIYLPTRGDVLIALVTLTAHSGNREGANRIIWERVVPLRDRNVLRVARSAVLQADFHFANELAQSGKDEEATALMRQAVDTARDPELKRQAEQMLASLDGQQQSNNYVELYNLGIQALNGQDFETARRHFEVVAAEAPELEIKQAARARLIDIEFYTGFKRAGSLAQSGQLKQARALLDSLSALPINGEQRAALTEFKDAIK